jgi:hypothetical protein
MFLNLHTVKTDTVTAVDLVVDLSIIKGVVHFTDVVVFMGVWEAVVGVVDAVESFRMTMTRTETTTTEIPQSRINRQRKRKLLRDTPRRHQRLHIQR